MKHSLVLLIGLISLSVQAQEKIEPFVLGETFEMHSDILKEQRRINVYLPKSYHPDSTQNYPVIYLLDGSKNEDFIHIAGLVQFCSFSWIQLIPETIVVGISNVDRKRDFTFPTSIKQDQEDFPTSGGSADFINFIDEELIPTIDKKYHTDTLNTLIGQSLGGLLATEILFKRPDLFDNYMIISPSLWWDSQSLLKLDIADTKRQKNVFIAVGKEGEIMEGDAKALYNKLLYLKMKELSLNFEFFEDKSHGDVLHQAIYNGFEKIFK